MKILITGGVKSGKSTFAEQKTLELSEGFTPLYLATAECLDEEMQTKIEEHRRTSYASEIESEKRMNEQLGIMVCGHGSRDEGAVEEFQSVARGLRAVSYTHLTLPTIGYV